MALFLYYISWILKNYIFIFIQFKIILSSWNFYLDQWIPYKYIVKSLTFGDFQLVNDFLLKGGCAVLDNRNCGNRPVL